MDSMLKTTADFFNFEQQERADRMIAFNADKVGFVFILYKATGFDVVQSVNLGIDFGVSNSGE